MAVATMRVPTVFTAVDRFSDVVSKMGAGVNRFGKNTTSALSRVDHKLNGVFNSMNGLSQLAIGGGVGGLFYYAGKDIMEFETAIASLGAVTGTQVGIMNSQIESLGKETGRSVIDIAKSFEIVGSKMEQYLKSPDQLKQITKESILLANASRMELEPAIDALTGVLNIYGLSAEKANYIVNKLSAGEVVGSIKIPETLDLLRQFGGTARLANVQVDESVALIQALTKSLGVEGVGRGIRNLLVDLNMVGALDSKKRKALEKVGVDFTKLADKTLPLIDRLQELKKLEGNGNAMGMFFKKTGIQTGATLFQNFDDLKRFLEIIRETNPALEQAKKNTSTFAYLIDRLKDSFTNYIVENKNANGALGITKSLISWMTDNMRNLINLISSVVIAFIGWKTIVGIVSLASGIVSVFNSIMKANLIITQIATFRAIAYSEALWLVVVAQWAAYWPILLVVGALGALVYAFWDTGEAAENSSTKQIDALMEQNKAYMGSTNVLSKELQKQATLIDNHNSKVLSPKQLVSNIINKEAQRKQEVLSNRDLLKPREIKPISEGLMSKLNENYKIDQAYGVSTRQLLRKNGLSYGEIMSSKENLAGKSDNEKFFNFIKNSKGELVVNVKVKGGEVESIDDSNAKGLPVKVTSTKTTTKK